MKVAFSCQLDGVNQRAFVELFTSGGEIDPYIITDTSNYASLPGLDQSHVYHVTPIWPDSTAAVRRYHPIVRQRYRSILKEVDPDLLVSLGASRLLFMGLTADFSPTIFLPQGGEVSKAVGNIYWDDRAVKRVRYRLFYRPIFRQYLRHVASVWGWAEANRATFRRFGLADAKFDPFDWGNVDIDRFAPEGLSHSFGDEGKTVIGTFRRIRGTAMCDVYEAFMDAAGRLGAERDDFHVVLGGFYGDGRSDAVERIVDEKVAEYGIDALVEKRSLVPKEEIDEYYRGLDVYVNFLFRDLELTAIGTTAKEAMACGCATVFFDEPDPRYVIDDGRNGVVTRPDTMSIKRTLADLLDDDAGSEAIATASRETVVENFSDDVVRERSIERFRRVGYPGELP